MTSRNGLPCPRCGGSGRVPDDRVLGAVMRAKRTAADLSLRDMAKRTGVTASYLCDLELGRRQWGAKQRAMYENAL